MQSIPEDSKKLYEQALLYDEAGDVYNATKLYKRIIKLHPEWPLAYFRLSNIYKQRQEWKPAYHYTKRALGLDPAHRDVWWDLGLISTALKKVRIARNVWNKFGLPSKWPDSNREVFSIQLMYEGLIEMVWAQSICPARAIITSIPDPASGRQYLDIVLYDRKTVVGHNIVGKNKMPIYHFSGLWKRSNYHTFSCWAQIRQPSDINALEKLCKEAGLGFENWTNSALTTSYQPKQKVEYFNANELVKNETNTQRIAIAARRRREVERVLASWRIIRLAEYDDLQQHN